MSSIVGAGVLYALAGSVTAGGPPATVVSDRNVPVERGARRETVAEGLEQPWGMAWLPDGTLLVTERPGRLRAIRDGRLEPQPVAGVPPRGGARGGGRGVGGGGAGGAAGQRG